MKDIQFPVCKKVKSKEKGDDNDDESTESENNKKDEEQSQGTNDDHEQQQSEEIEEEKQALLIEQNVNNQENGNEILISPPITPTAPKDKFLDSFTVFLVIAIVAILIKKFAFAVMEQL